MIHVCIKNICCDWLVLSNCCKVAHLFRGNKQTNKKSEISCDQEMEARIVYWAQTFRRSLVCAQHLVYFCFIAACRLALTVAFMEISKICSEQALIHLTSLRLAMSIRALESSIKIVLNSTLP